MTTNVALKSLKSATISMDEGSAYWTVTLEITNVGEFALFSPDDTFTINLYGEEFIFYVDSASLNKESPGEVVGTIQGVGLGADRDFPRAENITKTWETATAKSIVEELLGAGRIDSWDIEDWPVPTNKFAITEGSRLEAAKTLVAVVGGVIEGTPEGNFIVRNRHPVVPWKYGDASPDQIFDEQDSLVSISFDYTLTRYLDQVRVGDTSEEDYADEVETIMDEDQMGALVRVYPHPWRTDINLTTTADTSIFKITKVSEEPVVRQEKEIIEIIKGVGSLKYPVVSLDSLKWKVVPLQRLYTEDYSTKVYSGNIEEYSLVEINYTTKSIDFRVTSTATDIAQFLVESPIKEEDNG